MHQRVAIAIVALAFGAFGAAASAPAHGAEYKSVGSDPAILYDAPTNRGRKLWIAPRGMPVEVVVVQGDWVRVRDANGELSWVEKKALVDKRMLVANVATTLRSAADDAASAVLHVQQGVLLELVETPANGWAHVRHHDGAGGWVKVSEVWGL